VEGISPAEHYLNIGAKRSTLPFFAPMRLGMSLPSGTPLSRPGPACRHVFAGRVLYSVVQAPQETLASSFVTGL
jgi:hypothetical protein